jgi:hypothetical protein
MRGEFAFELHDLLLKPRHACRERFAVRVIGLAYGGGLACRGGLACSGGLACGGGLGRGGGFGNRGGLRGGRAVGQSIPLVPQLPYVKRGLAKQRESEKNQAGRPGCCGHGKTHVVSPVVWRCGTNACAAG